MAARQPWTPDPQRLESARAVLRDAAHAKSHDSEHAASVLAAAGTLHTLGAADEARALVRALDVSGTALLQLAVGALAPDALESAALDALDAARSLGLDRADESAAADRVLAALARRDRVELVLIGAECAAAPGSALPLELETTLAFFEQTVRPELYRFVPLGSARTGPLERIRPGDRARFWWRADGADVPENALDQLSNAALLIARFPAARALLEDMVVAQSRLDLAAAAPRAARANVVSLRDWAAQRARREASAGPANKLAVGFAAGEAVIVRREDFTVSFAEPDELLIDLLAERGAGLPMLSPVDGGADDGTLVGEEVTDCVDRFRFRLAGPLTQHRRYRLRVPLARGDVSVDLPLDDD